MTFQINLKKSTFMLPPKKTAHFSVAYGNQDFQGPMETNCCKCAWYAKFIICITSVGIWNSFYLVLHNRIYYVPLRDQRCPKLWFASIIYKFYGYFFKWTAYCSAFWPAIFLFVSIAYVFEARIRFLSTLFPQRCLEHLFRGRSEPWMLFVFTNAPIWTKYSNAFN